MGISNIAMVIALFVIVEANVGLDDFLDCRRLDGLIRILTKPTSGSESNYK
jgi:hypothetical protein